MSSTINNIIGKIFNHCLKYTYLILHINIIFKLFYDKLSLFRHSRPRFNEPLLFVIS